MDNIMKNIIELLNKAQNKTSSGINDELIRLVGDCERLFFNHYQDEKIEQLHMDLRLTRKTLAKLKNNISDEQIFLYTLGMLEGILKVYSLLLDEKMIKNKDDFDETVPTELYIQRGSYYCGHCRCDLTELIENWDWDSGYCPACGKPFTKDH